MIFPFFFLVDFISFFGGFLYRFGFFGVLGWELWNGRGQREADKN
jgi:hypothetical protein